MPVIYLSEKSFIQASKHLNVIQVLVSYVIFRLGLTKGLGASGSGSLSPSATLISSIKIKIIKQFNTSNTVPFVTIERA